MPLSSHPLEEPAWNTFYEFQLPLDTTTDCADARESAAWSAFKQAFARSLNSSDQVFQFSADNTLVTARTDGAGAPTTELEGTFYPAKHYYKLMIQFLYEVEVFALPRFGETRPDVDPLTHTQRWKASIKSILTGSREKPPHGFDENNQDHIALQFRALSNRIREEFTSGELLPRVTKLFASDD